MLTLGEASLGNLHSLMRPQHFDAFVQYMGSVPSSPGCHAAQARAGERETEGGRWKEGRREERKRRRKGTTGVASTADQEKSWIGG